MSASKRLQMAPNIFAAILLATSEKRKKQEQDNREAMARILAKRAIEDEKSGFAQAVENMKKLPTTKRTSQGTVHRLPDGSFRKM